MGSNVLSWMKALKMGYEPSLYPFETGTIPIGEITAFLEFKIWAKKVVAINCYFKQQNTDVRFQVTIYHKSGIGYKLAKDGIDFTTCPTRKLYRVTTAIRQTGKVFVKDVAGIDQ